MWYLLEYIIAMTMPLLKVDEVVGVGIYSL